MSVKIDTKGITSFKFTVRNGMLQGLLKGGQDIVKLASELAPVGDGIPGGHLNQSGNAEIISDKAILITFGNNLPDERAPAQEFGTMYMEAQPYIVPAMQEIDVLLYVKQELGLGKGKRR